MKGGVSQVGPSGRVQLCLTNQSRGMTLASTCTYTKRKLRLQVIFRPSVVASPCLDMEWFYGRRRCSSNTMKEINKTPPQLNHKSVEEFRPARKEETNMANTGQISFRQ